MEEKVTAWSKSRHLSGILAWFLTALRSSDRNRGLNGKEERKEDFGKKKKQEERIKRENKSIYFPRQMLRFLLRFPSKVQHITVPVNPTSPMSSCRILFVMDGSFWMVRSTVIHVIHTWITFVLVLIRDSPMQLPGTSPLTLIQQKK